MKLRTGDLTESNLDKAVALALNLPAAYLNDQGNPVPFSKSWTHGGPLIERDMMRLDYREGAGWIATRIEGSFICVAYGPTQLIAAMRCYVLARLGSEVDLPDDRS